MNFTDEIDKAWLAGFVDGEGYIGIIYQLKKPTSYSSSTPRYIAYLIIANSNKEVLEQIQLLIGEGKVYSARPADNKQKQAFQFKLMKKEVLLLVLKSILPYLKIKQNQCKILCDFLERRKTVKIVTGKRHIGTSFTSIDNEFYQKLLILNKRGPAL